VKRSKIIFFFILVFVLFGCYTKNLKGGKDFDSSSVHKITVGKTTKGEILSWFGEPLSKETVEDGKEVFKYDFINVDGKFMFLVVAQTYNIQRFEKSLDVTFKNNIVCDLDYLEGPLKINDFDKRYRLSKYSVKPPNNNNWYIRFLTNKKIIFDRVMNNPETHSVVLFIWLIESEKDLNNATDLKNIIEQDINDDKSNNRYKDVNPQVTKFSLNNFAGFKVAGKCVDVCVPEAPGVPFVLDATSLYLRHPSTPKKEYILIGYSQRYKEGLKPIDLETEIKPVLESFRYEESSND
jgi:hypothetical protein